MNGYADFIKKKLDTVLTEIQEYSWLFVNNPKKDFTRNRKLNFKEILNILLSIGGNSLNIELMKYFSYDPEAATCSAFVQQRKKILPEALEYLFSKFTSLAVNPNYYDGYRMLAVDGSDLCIAHNPNDEKNYFRATESAKGYNILHLNAMYDLCSRTYMDTIIQSGREENEFQALIDMVDRSDIEEKAIIIADLGYENYNVFEHIVKKNWNYVISVKDIYSNGIASGLSIPDKEIYHIRWGIETSFRELKYVIGLTSFHSKKADYILQEIFARLTMYNFCEIITTHIVIQQKNRKYSYQVNFTMAISICMHYFRCRNVGLPPNAEALIKEMYYLYEMVRKVRTKFAVSFVYRVA